MMIAPQLHFLADIADQMEQIAHHDDEHDQSSNEENTHEDHQQLLFKYLAESLQKQQQQQLLLQQKQQQQQQHKQQNGPIDFSASAASKKTHSDTDEEEQEDDEDEDADLNEKLRGTPMASSLPMIPPLLLRNKQGKPTRPFKAYPRDPLSLPLGFYSPLVPSSDNVLNVLASSTDDFSKQFRKRIQQAQERLINRFQDSPTKLTSPSSAVVNEKVHSPSSTTHVIPPKKRYRPNTPPPEISSSHPTPQPATPVTQENDTKDEAYWERRRKNNEAAKRSRDARRAKEDEIALRAAWLEQENLKLRLENAHLKQENAQLRCQIYGATDLSNTSAQS